MDASSLPVGGQECTSRSHQNPGSPKESYIAFCAWRLPPMDCRTQFSSPGMRCCAMFPGTLQSRSHRRGCRTSRRSAVATREPSATISDVWRLTDSWSIAPRAAGVA